MAKDQRRNNKQRNSKKRSNTRTISKGAAEQGTKEQQIHRWLDAWIMLQGFCNEEFAM